MLNTAIGKTAIVILAAGTSSRYGSPKQLLAYRGKNLLRHSTDVALATGCPSVFVVLGANMELIREELKDKPVILVENKGWKEGIASSIRCGLQHIAKTNLPVDCVIFMVCDQPHVSSSLLLNLLVKREETGRPVVASRYGNIIGTPALFHKTNFPGLMKLTGDKGAAKLMADHPDQVAVVPFPGGITDIDTKSDYEALIKDNDS